MRENLTTVLDLLGLILVIAGTVLIDWRVTVVTAGVLILIASYVLARPVRGPS